MLTSGGESLGTSQADILQRISQARGTSEPAKAEPTEVTEAVDVSEEAPETEEETTEEVEAVEESEETEEAEEAAEVESEIDDQEELYVEIDGREVSLSEIKEGLDGGLRQSDYTRKTQALAEERKAFEAEREAFREQASGVGDLAANLQAIIDQETLSPEDLQELREYEPEEFIKYQDKMTARKEALEKAKKVQPVSDVDVAAEKRKLWDANPAWMKDGKQTQAFTDDMNALQSYAAANGYTDEEISGISHARHWETLLKAAKFDLLQKKNSSIEKRVRKAPVTTKPKKASQTSLQEQIKKAEANLKRTGRAEDAVKLRQLKRKLNK